MFPLAKKLFLLISIDVFPISIFTLIDETEQNTLRTNSGQLGPDNTVHCPVLLAHLVFVRKIEGHEGKSKTM